MIVAPGWIEPTDVFENATADKRCGLKDDVVAVAEGVLEVPRARYEITVNPTQFVDNTRGTVDDINVRLPFERLDGGADCAGLPDVVSVQPGENVAFGELPSAVDGVKRSPVRFRNPSNPVAMLLEEVDRRIRGPAVDNDALEARIVLRKNALEVGCQIPGVVLTRHHNAHDHSFSRRFFHSALSCHALTGTAASST